MSADSFSDVKFEAKSEYDDFFTLWKDADPDVPLLIQAKSESAKLP
jgi:hypothetical protein